MTNYALDRKLEHAYTLHDYWTFERTPVDSKNYRRMKKKQDRLVHEIMTRAYEIPFYRQRFEETQTTPDDYHCGEDLYKFPVLYKDDLREWLDEEVRTNPERFEFWHEAPTSGSTGQPLRIWRSPRENAAWDANWLRTMSLAGFNPFTGKTMSRPNSLHTKSEAANKPDSPIQKIGILRRQLMSDTIMRRVDTQTLVDEINAYEPDYLYNHKNVLVRIAKYVKENDLYLWKPKFYSPVSEMLDEPSSILLREVFGPGLIDAYGLAETGTCVVKLPGNDYYQINYDTHVVNTYNADMTGPAPSGMAVVTPLMKNDLPLINYATLDRMDVFEKDGIKYVSRVQGRMNDVIHHTDGSITEWANISVIMNFTPEVVSYRFVQDVLDHLELLLVRNPEVPEEQQPAIEESLVGELTDLFKDPAMTMDVKWVDDIPADPNGKLRVIVSKL